MLQSQKIKLAIYALVFIIIGILLAFWIYLAQGQARDYQRISDLKTWQAVLNGYYFNYGTYQVKDCQPGMTLAKCLGAISDNVRINTKEDPLNYGAYRYIVGSMSETDYEIKFQLEAGAAGLKPGQYIWTKNGVRK